MRGVLVSLLLLFAALPHAGAAGGNAPFLAGFADVAPEFQPGAGAAITQLGADAVRFTLQWSPGTTAFSGTQKTALDAGIASVGSLRVVLAVYGTSAAVAPATQAARAEYCSFVADVVRQEPRVRDVVVWNEPNKAQFWSPQTGAPAAYEALLAQCYDALHASGVNVLGLALSHNGNDDASSTSPGAFVRAVGDAYRASGRTARILDTVAFHPYPSTNGERPWKKHVASKTIAQGDWNKLMYNLWLAFDGTGQPIPGNGGVTIWYTEDGFQSTVPAAQAAQYTSSENVATLAEDAGGDATATPSEDSPAPDQATQIRDAVALARCQPYVAAFFNFIAVDERPLAGWQSGPLYPDGTHKASYPAFASAFATSTLDCAALKGGAPSSDFLPPAAPASLTATASGGRVDLAWPAASDDGAGTLTYWIYRDGTRVATTTATLWSDTTVAARRTYAYAVRAIDTASNLGDAAAASATTPDVSPPTAVTGLAATGSVQLTWSAATDDAGVAGYDVARDGATVGTTAATSYTDPVAPGSYTYSVAAFDAAGNRGPAASVRVDVAAAPPTAGGGGGGGGGLPNLAVVLGAVSPTTVAPGGEVDLVVSVTEHGARSSQLTRLVIALPDGATLLGAPAYESGSGCTGTRTLDCYLDYVPNGGTTRVRFNVTLAASGTVSASATADADSDASDNAATLALTVAAPPAAVHAPAAPTKGRTLLGTARADRLRGTPYADVLNGRGGDDVLSGGLGADTLIGGPGDDSIAAADGTRDVIDCGRGRDTVVADTKDRVLAGCERVRRVRS